MEEYSMYLALLVALSAASENPAILSHSRIRDAAAVQQPLGGSVGRGSAASAEPGKPAVTQVKAMAVVSPAVRARSRQNLPSYVRADDYPSGALSRNEQGQVLFELTVSPAGQVTGCQILRSSGSTELDDKTCQIMVQRARFYPARNGRNTAVPDVVRSSIGWLISP